MATVLLPTRITDGDFSGWLRDAMAERRISQRVLAMRTGIHHSTISRLMSGDRTPSLPTAIAMIKVLSPTTVSARYGAPARDLDSSSRMAAGSLGS